MISSTSISRRGLFRGFACGCAAAATTGGSGFFASSALAASPKTALNPDQALARLQSGNAAFVAGGACLPIGGAEQISSLAKGQAPFAIIVGCSDSRTPPEHLFGAELGELFVIRVAGNTVDDAGMGSIEYGVVVLGAPLILVLGHTNCGAVDAGVKMVTEGAVYPGSIAAVVEPILPAVLKAQKLGGDLLANSVKTNVELVQQRIASGSKLVSDAMEAGKARITGGVYDLASGKVAFLT